MAPDVPPLELGRARLRIERLRAHPVARALLAAAEGIRVLLVGGVTRDAALGRRLGDFDAVVERDGARIAERLASTLGGRAIALAPGRFAALRIAAPEIEIDLWDLEGGDLGADLARRDLTINAIALDLGSGALLDPHGGLADLAGRRLRAIGAQTFSEDPLRVLRLARLVVILEAFEIEGDTAQLARSAAPALTSVAGERIRDELAQLAAGARPEDEQRALEEVGAFPGLWSTFSSARPGGSAIGRFARYSACRSRLDPRGEHPGEISARHAMRLLAAGDVTAPLDRLAHLADRAIVSRSESRAAARILELAGLPPPPAEALGIWIARLGPLWSAGLAVAAAAGSAHDDSTWDERLTSAARLVARRGASLVSPRPLLDGHEVALLLGLREGPDVGVALAALLRAQISERVATPEEARRYLLERFAD